MKVQQENLSLGHYFDDIDAAHSSDRQRALLPGIVLLVIAYFKDSVDDFFQVVEVCKGKRQC